MWHVMVKNNSFFQQSWQCKGYTESKAVIMEINLKITPFHGLIGAKKILKFSKKSFLTLLCWKASSFTLNSGYFKAQAVSYFTLVKVINTFTHNTLIVYKFSEVILLRPCSKGCQC